MFAGTMAVALAIEAALGWPAGLHARVGHPVTWMGRLITALDLRLNRLELPAEQRRFRGVIAVLIVVGVSVALAAFVQSLLPGGIAGALIGGALAFPFVASRSLHDHVAAVALPLARGDLGAARLAVAKIVGRDPNRLDRHGIARAAAETLAENASDGIVAPVFWGLLLGLPGIVGYKAVNTLDSMIGHRTVRHEAFGWAAARLDDLVNLVPARLSALLFAVVSGRPGAALDCVRRDAGHHRSPNAGWPEAAMAGALNMRLSGPRAYAGHVANEPYVNARGRDPDAPEILAALALFRRMVLTLGLILLFIASF